MGVSGPETAEESTFSRGAIGASARLGRLDYLDHDHRWRCHRSLAMDCPEPRPVQGPQDGAVVEVAEAGGLYRYYERRAA